MGVSVVYNLASPHHLVNTGTEIKFLNTAISVINNVQSSF